MVEFLHKLEERIAERKAAGDVANSYTARQLLGPDDEMYRKLPEEATELVLSCLVAQPDQQRRIREEAADLFFQYLLVLARNDVRLDEVIEILQARFDARRERMD